MFKNEKKKCTKQSRPSSRHLQLRPWVHDRQGRFVGEVVHLTTDECLLITWFRFCACEAILVSVLHNTDGNFDGTILDSFQRWVQAATFQIVFGDNFGQALSGDEENILGDGVRSGADHSKGHSGENVRVVALTGVISFSLVRNGWERRS